MEPIVLSGLLGIFVPPVVSFLKNAAWPTWAKQGAAIVVSAVVALLSLLQDGALGDASWKVIVANLAVVYGMAQVVYHTYFQSTSLNSKLEAKKVL